MAAEAFSQSSLGAERIPSALFSRRSVPGAPRRSAVEGDQLTVRGLCEAAPCHVTTCLLSAHAQDHFQPSQLVLLEVREQAREPLFCACELVSCAKFANGRDRVADFMISNAFEHTR